MTQFVIAFDVKGTIEGPKKPYVLALMAHFQNAGHEIIVWSNLYSYAVDCVRHNGLIAEASSKMTQGDVEFDEDQYMDLAIEDDRSQTWLSSKRFLFVDEIPESMPEIYKLAVKLMESL